MVTMKFRKANVMKTSALKTAILGCATGLSLLAFGGEPLITSGDNLVFMGDSITQFGKQRSHGYVNLVVKGFAANGVTPTWDGVGIQGETSGDMLLRFDRDVIAKSPTFVTIGAGVNDLNMNVPYATFMSNMQAMIDKVKAVPGAKGMLFSLTTDGFKGEGNVTDNLRKFVNGVQELAARNGFYYAPTHELFHAWERDPDTPLLSDTQRETCDGIHMSPAGDRQLARAVMTAFGFGADGLAAAEAAWNADETLVPLVRSDVDDSTYSVKLTDAENATLSSLGLQAVLASGIPSLAAAPSVETEADGAANTLTISLKSPHIGFKKYDQLIVAARKLGISVQDAIKCAVLRGVRDSSSLSPTAPVAAVNGVYCGARAATFDATVASVGATASACDVFLRYGASAGNLGGEKRISSGENGTFTCKVDGFEPDTTYFYELRFANNATTAKSVSVSGSFRTMAFGTGALEPNGLDDTAAIQAAIDAAAPTHGTVKLEGGVFTLSAELFLTNGVTLAGQGSEATTFQQTALHRVLTVKDGSRLEDLAVTGGKLSGNYSRGGGVQVDDGTLLRCRVVRNVCGVTGNDCRGGGVFIGKGTLDHCVIADNEVERTGDNSGFGGGIAIYDYRQDGEAARGEILIDTCLVADNKVGNGTAGGIGINYFYTSNLRTIRNTTVAGNVASEGAGGIAVSGMTGSKDAFALVSSIVAGNTAGGSAADAKIQDGASAAKSSNDLFGTGTAFGTDSLTGDPAFVDAANGDYRLTAASAAIAKGKATGGTDLDGNAFGAKPAIGCYEFGGSPAPQPKPEGVTVSLR